MQSLPANIYSVAAVREIDRIAIEDFGVPGFTLMQRAGAAAVRAARSRFPTAVRWQVVCGAGNNAGDGYVVARLAANDGVLVSVVTLTDPESLQGDAAKAWSDFVAEGGVVLPWSGELDSEADLIVDAILGSGLERDVSGVFRAAVEAINAHPAPVQAMDIPTGINGDTGAVMGCAVFADLTTTFVGLKAGLFLGAGPQHSGEITFADLAIDEECRTSVVPLYQRMDAEQLAMRLKPRERSAHKGDFGHVLIVGGGPGMPGAALLAGEAALRAGAGRVSIATYPDHAALLVARRPELMSHAITSARDLDPLLEAADVLAFGPGLGRSDWALAMFRQLNGDERPAVWDADALNLLAEQPQSAANRIITPHPGEAATLLDTTAAAVQADRPSAVRELRQRYGGVAVLKGAGTLVLGDSPLPFLCTAGNPGMAAPGMGDALTGIIAALLAQGFSLAEAAAAGVELHAAAGDLAAAGGERGLLASDLIAALRRVVNP